MKTKIKRHYRSVVSVLLSVCMLVSCMTVGLIATDAAKITDSESVGYQYTSCEWVNMKICDSSGNTVITVKNSATENQYYDFTISSAGNYGVKFTVKAYKDGGSSYDYVECKGEQWGEGKYAKNISNYYAPYVAAGKYQIKWSNFVSYTNDSRYEAEVKFDIIEAPTNITLSVGSIDDAEAYVKVGSTTIAEDGSATVTPGSTATVVVTPDSDSERATTVSVTGITDPIELVNDGTGKYTGTFVVPDSNATVSFDALADKRKYHINVVSNHGGTQTVAPDEPDGGYMEGSQVTLTATDAGDTGYAFDSWSKGTTPKLLSTTYVVNPSDASGETITINADYVSTTETITLYLDIKGASPAWSVPPHAAVYNREGANTLDADMTMTLYKGTVYQIVVPKRADRIQFFDAENKLATQTDKLSIPGDGYVYKLRSKSWDNDPDKTYTNVKSARLGDSITTNNNIYSNINATFFDYFTDNEILKSAGWYNGIDSEKDAWIDNGSGDYWKNINRNPYTIFNTVLSEYAAKESKTAAADQVLRPGYFGSFVDHTNHYAGHDGWTYYHADKSSTDYGADAWHGPKTNVSNDLWYSGASESTKSQAALSGLAGNILTDSNGNQSKTGDIHHYANDAGANYNGKTMAYFDEDFLSERTAGSYVFFKASVNWWHSDDIKTWAYFSNSKSSSVGSWAEMTADGDYYKATVPSGKYDTVRFYRVVKTETPSGEPNDSSYYNRTNATSLTGHVVSSASESNASVDGDNKNPTWTNHWTNRENYAYSGPLAEIIHSNFPVVKRVAKNNSSQDSYTYYEFDSTDAKDNIYFNDIFADTPVMQYGGGTGYGVKAGYKNNQSYGFFPFDKHSDGNASNTVYGKDLGLGMKLEIEFTLGNNGRIIGKDGNSYDQKFNFSGDDDLWVYIDGQLVLDLGGNHDKTTGSINFASNNKTMSVTVDKEDTNFKTSTKSFSIDNQNTSATHTMTMYYMERGMHESNLWFNFSFSPIGNQFVNEKTVTFDNVNSALQHDVENAVATDTFTYNLKQSAAESAANYSNMAEKDYALDGKTKQTTDTSGNFSLNPEHNAVFIDQLTTKHYFQVTETQADANKFKYTPTLSVFDMIRGTIINETGSGENAGYYFYTTKPSPTDMDATKIKALWTNDVQTKDIVITKAVPDGVPNNPFFTVQVLVKLPGEADFTARELKITQNGIESELHENGQVLIRKGQSFTVLGVPVGTMVQVSEPTLPGGFSMIQDSTTATGAVNGTVAKTSNSITFTVGSSGENVAVTLTNDIPMQTVTVKKVVTNSTDTTTAFPITVKIKSEGSEQPDFDASYQYSFDGGATKTFTPATLSDGISINLASNHYASFRLPIGAYVSVNEPNFGSSGTFANFIYASTTVKTYETDDATAYTGANDSGATSSFTVADGKDAHVIVTNVGKGYDVTIKKKLVSGTSAKLYTVNVKAGEAAYSGEYEIYDKNGTQITTRTMTDGAVDLGVDEYVVLKAVAENTELEVTEKVLNSTYVRAFHYGYTSVKVGSGSTLTTQDEGGITASTNPQKIDNGVSLTVTAATSVEVYNKPWTYFIKYQYPGYLQRYYPNVTANQWYDNKGAFTDSDFEEDGLMTIGTEVATGSETYPCPKFKGYDDSYDTTGTDVKGFITARAPYQDNFMTTMTWDPVLSGDKPNTNIFYYPLQDTQNVYVTVTADADAQKGIQVYFKLPYEFESWVENTDTSLDPKAGTDGKVMRKTDSYYYRVDTQYGLWVTKNRSQDRNTAKWVEAAPEIYDAAGNRYVFRHWEMKSVGKNLLTNVEPQYIGQNPREHALKDEYEYKRCYSRAFNMTLYQDSYVEPIYILDSDSDASLTPKEREAKDTGISTQYGGAFINFLENSRNQWNDQGGILYGENGEKNSDRVNQGDRVFSDFLFSFNYNDVMLQSSLGKYKTVTVTVDGEEVTKRVFEPYKYNGQEIKFKYGFVLEKAADITDTNENGYLFDEIKTQAEYRALYNSAKTDSAVEGQTQMQAAIAYITNNTNSGNFLLKEEYSAGALDNKNEIEYSTSIPVISHGTGAALAYKNYVYRAYAYLKDYTIAGRKSDYTWNGEPISDEDWIAISNGSHNGSVLEISAPVYFTIYNIASVANGTPFDDEGGQS